MKRAELIRSLKSFFQGQAEKFQIELAFLYGSWASGIPKKGSDIDVAVVFQDQPDTEITFKRLTELTYLLTKKLGIEVSILPISLDFKEPMLYYNTIVLGEPVYIKKFQRYVNLKNRALFEMEDFSLFGKAWQLQLARKRLKELKDA